MTEPRGGDDTAGRIAVPTSGGIALTDELLASLAAQAERGYDPSRMRPRTRRPSGSAQAT